MRILLIRHGETTGDVEDKYGGFYDDHLTSKGQSQLRETADRLKGEKIDVIFTSSLIRAQESAKIINTVVTAEVVVLEGLKERNYGILGGLTKEEAKAKYPEAVELHKDPKNTDPQGESQEDFINRVLETFKTISGESYGTVVAISHGGPIKTILRHLGLPLLTSIGDGEIIEVNV